MNNEQTAHIASEALKASVLNSFTTYALAVDKERNKPNKSMAYAPNIQRMQEYQTILNWINTDAPREIILSVLAE